MSSNEEKFLRVISGVAVGGGLTLATLITVLIVLKLF